MLVLIDNIQRVFDGNEGFVLLLVRNLNRDNISFFLLLNRILLNAVNPNIPPFKFNLGE